MRYVKIVALAGAVEALGVACRMTTDAQGLRLSGDVSPARLRAAVLGAMTALLDGDPVIEEGTIILNGGFGGD